MHVFFLVACCLPFVMCVCAEVVEAGKTPQDEGTSSLASRSFVREKGMPILPGPDLPFMRPTSQSERKKREISERHKRRAQVLAQGSLATSSDFSDLASLASMGSFSVAIATTPGGVSAVAARRERSGFYSQDLDSTPSSSPTPSLSLSARGHSALSFTATHSLPASNFLDLRPQR